MKVFLTRCVKSEPSRTTLKNSIQTTTVCGKNQKKNFPKDARRPWFDNVKVGHNTHHKFMSRISEDCKLSRRYTNHCLRVTGITNLTRGKFNAKQIISVSGHKSLDSLAIYQRVQSDEKLMMGMCLTFSLLKPDDALLLSKNIEVEDKETIQEKPQPKALPPAPTAALAVMTPETSNYFASPNNLQQPLPLENALVSYVPQQEEASNFDLLSLIADVENDEIPDEDLLLAATQYEQSVQNVSAPVPQTTTNTSTTTTSYMRRSNQPTQFTNCTIGSIGTINIHIHKH